MNAKRPTYHYRKKHHHKRLKRYAKVVFITIAVVLMGWLAITLDILRNRSEPESTDNLSISQTVGDDVYKYSVDEPTFSMVLPGDWEEVKRIKLSNQTGIVWQATRDKQANRYLTMYIDNLPPNIAVNRVIPLEATGEYFKLGNLSQPCHTFTVGGTANLAQANKLTPRVSKWEDVDFICNLTNPLENQIGTSSKAGVNRVDITGDKQGKHSYFFVYTDHNKQPNDQIFLDALRSFKAK